VERQTALASSQGEAWPNFAIWVVLLAMLLRVAAIGRKLEVQDATHIPSAREEANQVSSRISSVGETVCRAAQQ
jgi:hypothetical protein